MRRADSTTQEGPNLDRGCYVDGEAFLPQSDDLNQANRVVKRLGEKQRDESRQPLQCRLGCILPGGENASYYGGDAGKINLYGSAKSSAASIQSQQKYAVTHIFNIQCASRFESSRLLFPWETAVREYRFIACLRIPAIISPETNMRQRDDHSH